MFSTPHFDDMEELYSAYRPITPSLSNSRPSNSEQMKYSTQPTDRIPLHDFRRDSLELYGLKPRHYPVEDSSSEQEELATDSSDAPSAPFQPKWKEWIMEKRQGIEELEKQLDNFKMNGVENELEEFSDDNSLKYKVFNPPDEYKYTPFHDRDEEPVLSHENILTNMHQNMHRSRWTANRIRLNIDKVISREEKRTGSEPVPGAFPREIVYLPIPVHSEDRRNSTENGFEDCESLGGPITYLSRSILVPFTVKLLSFVMYHLASLSQRNYTFSGTSAEALHLLIGLDKTMTGVGGLYAAQSCLDYIIDFPLACHTRYHLLKYGIEIVRDSGSEYIWNEHHKEFLKLHNRALEEFQNKLKRKLWFSFFILTMFSLLGTLFVGWIHVMTWSNGDVGNCFNNILFGRAQLAGLVFCLLGQTCYECMSYFKQFIGQYAEETMDLLMKKLEQCKELQERRLNQMQQHYNQAENRKADRKKPFNGSKNSSNTSDFSNTSSSEDKNDVLLISTPENSSSVVYRPQPYISPLKGRSEINSKSLHLVDPSSPPTVGSHHSLPVSKFESTSNCKSRSPVNPKIAYGVTTTFQKEGSVSYLIRAVVSLFKLPFKLTLLYGRFVLHLFPWRLYVSLTRD